MLRQGARNEKEKAAGVGAQRQSCSRRCERDELEERFLSAACLQTD